MRPPSPIRAFHKALHAWYAAHGRKDLPWRNTKDPYAIYISEIMLQQTQVETVLQRYYHPFLKRFPTLERLAEAKPEDVLKAWQGLGYYNRAANLHQAAKAAGKKLPDSVEGLMALPGIGQNTAHAVATFAFSRPVPVLEANVKRVMARIFALKKPAPRELWEKAHVLLDAREPFDYNQAMMDLGAMLCTPRNPQCAQCPAAGICKGKEAPESYPEAKQKKAVPVRKTIIVVRQDSSGRIHATPREGRFLHGMYQFDESNSPPAKGIHLGQVSHAYSHFVLRAEVYLLNCPQPGGRLEADGNGGWFTPAQFKKLPHSRTEQKILALLDAARKAA